MSAKKEPLNPQFASSISFAGEEDTSFQHVQTSSHKTSTHKETADINKYKHIQQFEKERENIAPNSHPSPITAIN